MSALRQEAKSHRKPVLLASFLISLVLNIGLRLLTKNRVLSIVFIVLIFYFFIQHIYHYIKTGRFDLELAWNKTSFSIVLFDLVLVLLSLALILILERIPPVRKWLTLLVFFLFTIFSFQMHAFAYYMKENETSLLEAIRKSIAVIWTYKRKHFYLFLDYFKVAIQWTLLAILLNILVYSQKIPAILELPEAESGKRLIEVFTSPLSRFIQNTMISIAMFYMFYLGAFYVYTWLSGRDHSARS